MLFSAGILTFVLTTHGKPQTLLPHELFSPAVAQVLELPVSCGHRVILGYEVISFYDVAS